MRSAGIAARTAAGVVVCGAVIVLLASCARRPDHLGVWTFSDHGIRGTIVFAEDGTLTVTTNEYPLATRSATVVQTYRYRMDYSKKPIWLDLYESPRASGPRGRGPDVALIVEFRSRNVMRIAGTDGHPRPRSFSAKHTDVVTFSRAR